MDSAPPAAHDPGPLPPAPTPALSDRCSNCGAPPRRGAARFCTYCGAAFPAAQAPPPSALEGRARALALLQEQREFAEAMRRTPSVAMHVAGAGCPIAFLCVWIAMAIGMGVFAGGFGGAPFPFALVPFGMAAVGVFMLLTLVRRAGKLATGKLEREPAVVVSQRTSRGEKSSTDHVTLEYENGDREEYQVSGKLAGQLAVGDMGVAYEKGGYLVDFTRIDLR